MKVFSFFRDHKFQVFKTLAIYFSYCSIGSSVALIGSSILDLQIKVNVDFKTISYLIPSRSIGHIVGLALAGVLDRHCQHSLILLITGFFSGIFIAAAPNFTEFKLVAAFLFISGILHGVGENTCNTLLAVTWKEKSANWLQVLHMFWGIGSLLSPMICRPLLLPENEDPPEKLSNMTDDVLIVHNYTPDDVLVQYAFLIIAILSLISAVPFGFIYLKERKRQNVDSNHINKVETDSQFSPLKIYTAVAIVAGIGHITFSLETLLGSLGPALAVKSDLHMEKKTGVLLTSVFWTFFSFFRLVFTFMTFFFSTTKLLLVSLAIAFAGFTTLAPWANYYSVCMWLGFALIGIGASPLFSASYAMLAKNFALTSWISSMIYIPSYLGMSMHPTIAANLLDRQAVQFLYYIGGAGIILIILYLTLITYCSKVFVKTIKQPISGKSSPRNRY